ncbi:hypothetical protein M5D96_010696 [Drosophila gunungcola]|uniref:Uncharacterized protein n=1 Tax=Drosophila gunungcola TaxID=103775 RepID=A0A9P9YGJ3_9MUSC|nr:hypothetical protein M5D96_010696 [Drosophila gunungcola]
MTNRKITLTVPNKSTQSNHIYNNVRSKNKRLAIKKMQIRQANRATTTTVFIWL